MVRVIGLISSKIFLFIFYTVRNVGVQTFLSEFCETPIKSLVPNLSQLILPIKNHYSFNQISKCLKNCVNFNLLLHLSCMLNLNHVKNDYFVQTLKWYSLYLVQIVIIYNGLLKTPLLHKKNNDTFFKFLK